MTFDPAGADDEDVTVEIGERTEGIETQLCACVEDRGVRYRSDCDLMTDRVVQAGTAPAVSEREFERAKKFVEYDEHRFPG